MSKFVTVAKALALGAILMPAAASAQTFPDGYFRLTTQFREGANECLEGNQVGGSMNGTAFMDTCQDVTGQLWRAYQ